MAVRRYGGKAVTGSVMTLGLLCLLATARLAAQVGHEPGKSPYRDITRGSSITFMAGYLGGDGGSLGIGPRHGMTYGVLYDLRTSGFVTGGLALTYMDLERDVLDADAPKATRRTGPFKQTIINPEAILQFNLTGGKAWHHIAPFFVGGVGYALGSDVKSDTSGFQFGNRFTVSPGFGFRYFLGSHLHLRFEARRHFWKLKYPSSYLDDPANAPTGSPVITTGKTSVWMSSWWMIGGVSFSF
jgi:hypothetical protein